MRNPLNKRIPRELKSDFGKYLVIFLFMVMLGSLISGFLVADHSVRYAYDESVTKYHLEWGHFTLSAEPEEEFFDDLAEKAEVDLYDLRYFEEEQEENGANIRVYPLQEAVNVACLLEGKLPEADNEIAIDRVYAQNNDIEVGDTVTLNDRTLSVVGFVALPDYSCLFEKNTDMMFDSVNFSIAVMTNEGFDATAGNRIFYNYAWMYRTEPADDIEEKEASDAFLEDLKEVLTDYDEKLFVAQGGMSAEMITLTGYVPRYSNQAVNFAGEDMGSDKASMILFDYIVTVILAFVFAVTISGTITKEAGVIGTLRASGYTKGELIRHYMILPVAVTLIAALVGNLIGYTWLKDYVAKIYGDSYSLCSYETLWNAEAFIDTTIVPLILMAVINFLVLKHKLQFSPLDFLRRDLKKKKKKKAFRLNSKIPFLHRFRIRILFQNIPNYLTLFIGIQLAAVIVIFGIMYPPLLDDYAELVENSMISTYQYVLKTPVETDNSKAEKYFATELETTDARYMTDEITVYGIEEDSAYIDNQRIDSLSDGTVLVSNGVMDKFGLSDGDTLTLKSHYADTTYDFVVAGRYDYDAGLAVFMQGDDYRTMFEKEADDFTGYFTDERLTDIDEAAIATIITQEDMTKVSRQLKVSMGSFMSLFYVFGVIMFILLMYLLSKQILEKNASYISMTKILGFTDGEIGRLYIVATSVVVVISLLLAVPLTDAILRWMFRSYIYTEMTGYIPYIVSPSCFVLMIVLGLLSYGAVSILQLVKIRRIPKSDALKNAE
jgi:putative ABC transport system permease protein